MFLVRHESKSKVTIFNVDNSEHNSTDKLEVDGALNLLHPLHE